MKPLHPPPAVVFPSGARGRGEVDLFPQVLADVSDDQVSRRPVESPSPRVAQAVCPDLVAAGCPHEGIGRRDGVRPRRGLSAWHGARAADVQTQQLAEQDVFVLRVVGRIASRAAVAGPHVQVPVIRREHQMPAVVIGVRRVGYHEHDRCRGRVGDVGIARDVVAGQRDVARRRDVVRVIDVEEAVRGVVRIEGHRQESLLRAVGGQRRDVEKRRPEEAAVLDDADRAPLRHDEEPRGVARRGGHLQRLADSAGHQGERDRRVSGERGRIGRPLGAGRRAADLVFTNGGAASGARGVPDRVAGVFVEMIEGSRVGVGDERASRAREAARVAQNRRDADLVEKTVVRGMEDEVLVLFPRTEGQEWIVRGGRRRVVRIRDVAVRAVALDVEDAVHVQPHPAVRAPPFDRDVVPARVEDVPRAADRPVAGTVPADPEDDGAAGDRDAQLAVEAEPVPMDDDVAVAPGDVRSAGDRRCRVVGGAGLHPELDREVPGSDVGGRAGGGIGGGVDRDLHAVGVARPRAVEAKRR